MLAFYNIRLRNYTHAQATNVTSPQYIWISCIRRDHISACPHQQACISIKSCINLKARSIWIGEARGSVHEPIRQLSRGSLKTNHPSIDALATLSARRTDWNWHSRICGPEEILIVGELVLTCCYGFNMGLAPAPTDVAGRVLNIYKKKRAPKSGNETLHDVESLPRRHRRLEPDTASCEYHRLISGDTPSGQPKVLRASYDR